MSRSVGVTELLRDALPEWTAPLFTVLSAPGSLACIVPALGLLYLHAVADAARRESSGDPQPLCPDRTARLIGTVLGGLAFAVLVKAALSAPRTPASFHAASASEYGFPSGHTMAATVFWGAIALWSTVGRRTDRLVVAALVISVVGLSRLALGVHYLVDVLAAIVLGAGYLVAVARLTRGEPRRAFAVAIAIAAVAVIVSAAGVRSLIALAGTVGAAAGRWALERPPVRRRVIDATQRLRSA